MDEVGEGKEKEEGKERKRKGLNDNFVCQLGWTMVPRYLAKHQFESCLESSFQIRLTLKSVLATLNRSVKIFS